LDSALHGQPKAEEQQHLGGGFLSSISILEVMQVASVARRASRVLRASLCPHSSRCVFYQDKHSLSSSSPNRFRDLSTSSIQNLALLGVQIIEIVIFKTYVKVAE